MTEAGIEGLLRRPGQPAVIGVRDPDGVERLGHRHVAARGVLGQIRRNPADDDPSGVRLARQDLFDPVAEGLEQKGSDGRHLGRLIPGRRDRCLQYLAGILD